MGAGGEAVPATGTGRGVDGISERTQTIDVAPQRARAHPEALGELLAGPEPMRLEQREQQQGAFGGVAAHRGPPPR